MTSNNDQSIIAERNRMPHDPNRRCYAATRRTKLRGMEPALPDPESIDAAVLGAYGATMFTVQAFERSLAALVLVLGVKSSKTGTFKNDEQFRKYIHKMISRTLDAFQRASAKALRNRLPENFDPELKTEIENLIVWRDRLAHRYLVENARVEPPHFKMEMFLELWQLCKPFQEMSAKLTTLMLERLAELPKTDAPSPVREVFSELARTIMLGEQFKQAE